MIFTEGMRKIEFLLLKRDIDRVLEYLGVQRCLQVSDTVEEEMGETYRKYQDLINRIKSVTEYVGLSFEKEEPAMTTLRSPTPEDLEIAETILSKASKILENEKKLLEEKMSVESTLQEIRIFQKMNFPLKELENVTYLIYRYGSLDPARLPDLEANLVGRAVLFPLGEEGRVFIVALKKGRFALETELKKAEFRDLPLPEDAKNLTQDLVENLEETLRKTTEDLSRLEEEKKQLIRLYGETLTRLHAVLLVGSRIEELKGHLEQSEQTYRLVGWVPESLVQKTVSDLEAITQGRIAIRVYEPEEIPSVREGKEKIPVRLKHGKFFQSFDGIVFAYGAPLYGTIDPTPLVSFFFILLFAIMFGDMGQGFLIFLGGVLMDRDTIKSFRKWKKFAPAFKSVGIASMFTGILYGSCFASETLLIPVERALTNLILGTPQERFISLMPTGGEIDRLLAFFGFTLSVGIVINSIGLILNIYNRFRQKDIHNAVFSKTGLVGASFFWYALSIGIRVILFHSSVHTADLIILSILLILLFWGEPIARIIEGKRPLFPDGAFSFVMEGIVEVLESISYYISNSVSFLRVGAFALSHTVLSLIVFQIVDLVQDLPGGILFQALIILLGNSLILFLEGLIVTIQVIRLQYYEFFSKFFTESGTPFKPFDLTQT